jgi:hypothetical protein
MKYFLLGLSLLCCGCAGAQTNPYIVTFPYFDSTKPIHVMAKDRAWALASCCSATVWTQEEWDKCGKDICNDNPHPEWAQINKQLICDWQTDHWQCPTTLPIRNSNVVGDGKLLDAPPFDVPPKEWDENKNCMSNRIYRSKEEADAEMLNGYGCPKVHHFACADKSRFLLTDESGKKHCLRLVP